MSRKNYFDRDDIAFYPDRSTSKTADWLTEFAIKYEKQSENAVEQARKRQADSDFYSQISSIIGGKPKHATVESIVKEYQELTGLNKYLKTLAEKDELLKSKTAEDQSLQDQAVKPELPNISNKLLEKVKIFIDNKISSYNGYISIPAIQDDLLRSLKQEGLNAHEVYDPTTAQYIGFKLSEYNKNKKDDSFNHNLGKAVINVEDDGSNTNFLHSLTKKE